MDDPASGKKLLSLGSGDWEAPSWAPDGRHLVCTRRTGSRHELMMVDTWYGKARSITNAGEFTLPNWSDLF
jgi:TolB protein